jgi:hypothetical protein
MVPRIAGVASKNLIAPTNGGPHGLRDPPRRLGPIGYTGLGVFGQVQELEASAPAVYRHPVEPTDDDGITGSDAGFLPYDDGDPVKRRLIRKAARELTIIIVFANVRPQNDVTNEDRNSEAANDYAMASGGGH